MVLNISFAQYFVLGLAPLLMVGSFVSRRFQRGPTRFYNTDLSGQVVVITGCSAGIGKESAREIAKYQATIVFACRDEQKTMKVISQIKAETNNQNLFFMKLDLQNYDSIKNFSTEFHKNYKKLNVLVNNAGVAFLRPQKDQSGHDQNFKTNHMGHFLLTNLLMDLIVSTKKSRVINVSSEAHKQVKSAVNFDDAYNSKIDTFFLSYGSSKYANILFTNQLQKLFDQKNIESKAVSLHPGVVSTDIIYTMIQRQIVRFILYPFTKILLQFTLSETEGAWTTNYLALQPYEDLKPSGYYEKNKLSKHSKFVTKFDQGEELWKFSEKTLNLKAII